MIKLNAGDWAQIGGKLFWFCRCAETPEYVPMNLESDEWCARCGTPRPPKPEETKAVGVVGSPEELVQEMEGNQQNVQYSQGWRNACSYYGARLKRIECRCGILLEDCKQCVFEDQQVPTKQEVPVSETCRRVD